MQTQGASNATEDQILVDEALNHRPSSHSLLLCLTGIKNGQLNAARAG